MEHCVHLKDLRALAPSDQDSELDRLVRVANAPVNGQAAILRARITAYEARYEMTSETMVSRLAKHEVEETGDYADWLFWLKLKELSGS